MARRVLVVDDEEQIRRLIGVVLAEAGYVPDCAAGGEEALTKVGGNSFDLITLDLAMPGVDGWEVLERLERKSCSPPVLVVSANCATPRPRPLFGCLAGWLPKPFRVEELLRPCDRVLRPKAQPPPEGFFSPRRAERRQLLLPA